MRMRGRRRRRRRRRMRMRRSDSTRVNHDIFFSLILSHNAATPQGETIELYHTGYGLTTSGQV